MAKEKKFLLIEEETLREMYRHVLIRAMRLFCFLTFV